VATTFSHSRLSSFEDCPKKYEYRYIRKIKRDTESIEGFVGKRVHDVLERLYKAVRRGQVPTLPQVLTRYRALFDENFDPERVQVVRKETPIDEYRENGERGLSNYYRKHYPFDADETLGVEERINFDLDGTDRYRILGFVDRISRARDGALEVHDYKTSRWVPKQEQLDTDRQLALYQIAVNERYGADQPVRLDWHYVVRNQTRTSTRTPEQLDGLRSDTVSLIERIGATSEFEPRTSTLCSWCEYNDICPAIVGEERAKAAEAAADGAKDETSPPQNQLSLL
jgi:putative RecB family exonuclease